MEGSEGKGKANVNVVSDTVILEKMSRRRFRFDLFTISLLKLLL
jgi:hypothetical protein